MIVVLYIICVGLLMEKEIRRLLIPIEILTFFIHLSKINPSQYIGSNIYIYNRDFFEELSKFGRLEALHVCDNLGDHMIGHVYAKFELEEEAADALNILNGRYYDGRRLDVEFSPVTDFREARCRDFDEDTCRRGGFCNFMHIKPVPGCLIRDMEDEAEDERRREEMERMDRRSNRGSSSRGGDRRDRGGGGGDRGRSSRKEKKSSSRKGGGSSRSRSRSRSRSGNRDRAIGGVGGEV